MTLRTVRWVAGGVAALSIALLLGGLPLMYLGRHVATAGLWNFPDVFEELTFVAVPVVGLVLASRRPANKIGWIFLDASRTPMGSGQRHMADRLAALDGRLEVRSVPDKGTTITAHLPLPAVPAGS